jgi:hypothetical protein
MRFRSNTQHQIEPSRLNHIVSIAVQKVLPIHYLYHMVEMIQYYGRVNLVCTLQIETTQSPGAPYSIAGTLSQADGIFKAFLNHFSTLSTGGIQ